MTAEIFPRLLNEAETAAYLGIQKKTLATWRCLRRYPLPFIRVGRAIRYRLSDVEAFLATRTIGRKSDEMSERVTQQV